MSRSFHRNLLYLPVAFWYAPRLLEFIDAYERSQWEEPGDDIERVKALLAYCNEFVPAYRKKFSGIDLAKITGEDLASLPFTTKEEIKHDASSFVSSEKFYFCTTKTTGGSTGQPVTLVKTREAMSAELAAAWRGYGWAGVGMGDKQARLWGVPFTQSGRIKARAIDFVCNRVRFSAFSFDEGALRGYYDAISRVRPVYFYGYASMLYQFAKFLKQSGLRLGYRPKAVISTSEVLYDAQREVISSALECPVFNEYGCGEVGTIAHECEHGALHCNTENLHLEIIKDGSPCKQGEVGELCVTELNNKAFPLVRYRIGDFASLSTKPCPCGRKLPVLENLHGRQYDCIKTPDGRVFHGEFFMYIFEEIKRLDLGVDQFQVRQTAPDSFDIAVVPDGKFSDKTLSLIEKRVREQLGGNVTVRVRFVDGIQREASGKMRLIIGLEG